MARSTEAGDEPNALDELRRHLRSQSTGDHRTLVALLGAAWPYLTGADDHAMRSFKLSRIEGPSWESPILRFVIERHGGTVPGSKRAELQAWEVNLDAATAEAFGAGFRQLVPKSCPVRRKGPCCRSSVSGQ
jgi:hypothetical protein